MTQILIVDDDEIFTTVLASALRRRGLAPWCAHTSQEAYRLVHAQAIESVVLDLRLATESGLDMISTLCTARPGVKIIVLTGYASIATAVEAIKLGAHHYLTKPIDVTTLLDAFAYEPGIVPTRLLETPTPLDQLEWEHIQRALIGSGGNVSAAAAALGMHRRTLQRRLKKRPSGLR